MGAHEKETQHTEPHYLLKLHEEAHGPELDGAGIQAWVEWEMEAMLWRVPVDSSRAELERLIEHSAERLKREKRSPVRQSYWLPEALEVDAIPPGGKPTHGWPFWWEVEAYTEWDEEAGA